MKPSWSQDQDMPCLTAAENNHMQAMLMLLILLCVMLPVPCVLPGPCSHCNLRACVISLLLCWCQKQILHPTPLCTRGTLLLPCCYRGCDRQRRRQPQWPRRRRDDDNDFCHHCPFAARYRLKVKSLMYCPRRGVNRVADLPQPVDSRMCIFVACSPSSVLACIQNMFRFPPCL